MSANSCRGGYGGDGGRDGIEYSKKPFVGMFLTISALPLENEANVNVNK